MKPELTYEGSCSCRKVRYRMNAKPLIVHACHCRQCQRVTGSAFVMNALIERTKVELLCGDMQSTHFPGTFHTAFFCRECATFVWSEYKSGRFDDCWFIRVAPLVVMDLVAVVANKLAGDEQSAARWAERARKRRPDICQQMFFQALPFSDSPLRYTLSDTMKSYGF